MVGGLELLDGLGVPPDHDVGVGPQSRDVVDAPHHDAVVLDVGEQRRRLRASLSRSSPKGWTEANTDHMAYRIESLISRTTDGAGLRVGRSLMTSLWLA